MRVAGRGLGAGVAAAGSGELGDACAFAGLAGRCATRVFLRLLSADSARSAGLDSEVRMAVESNDDRAGASSPDAPASGEPAGLTGCARLSTACRHCVNISLQSPQYK